MSLLDFYITRSQINIKSIYTALLTSADTVKCCTETQPKSPNSKQCRCKYHLKLHDDLIIWISCVVLRQKQNCAQVFGAFRYATAGEVSGSPLYLKGDYSNSLKCCRSARRWGRNRCHFQDTSIQPRKINTRLVLWLFILWWEICNMYTKEYTCLMYLEKNALELKVKRLTY
jgi:hypothetical protein